MHHVLLVAHGSRSSAANDQARALCGAVRAIVPGGERVHLGFIELATPTMQDALSQVLSVCRSHELDRVTILPVLLTAAAHVKRDIAELAERSRAERADIPIHVAPHIGAAPAIQRLFVDHVRHAATRARRGSPAAVIVSRGSGDPAAHDETLAFVRVVARDCPIDRVSVAYLAVREPTPIAAIEAAVQAGADAVTVVPHLIFAGRLLLEIDSTVLPGARTRMPSVSFDRTPILADDPAFPGVLASIVRNISGPAVP